MDILAIDAGNTSIKWALFSKGEIKESKSNATEFELITIANQQIDAKIIISTVGSALVNFMNLVEEKDRVFFLDQHVKIPLKNEYATPETLGPDRLAAACGAWSKIQNQHLFIIDAGTCITYDFVSKEGIYKGGMITPGINLRYKALHDYTNRLPLVTKENGVIPLLGQDTLGSIKSGVQNGILNEINGAITSFKEHYGDIQVFLCGGDAVFFESQIKHAIFADPNLVLSGLHAILVHHLS